jgi:cytochrome b pre-mRNA-processing protein 3
MTRDTRLEYTAVPASSSATGNPPWHRRILARLGHGRGRRAIAAALYATLVAQARQPVFYARWGVPDSRDGRLEMVGLHAILLMRRLRAEGPEGVALAQATFDRLFEDLDRHLREWGVGDPSVGKRMKELAQSFMGRVAALELLLAGGDPQALADLLRRNVYTEVAAPAQNGIDRLAAYLAAQERWLAAQDGAALLRGRIEFASPAELS